MVSDPSILECGFALGSKVKELDEVLFEEALWQHAAETEGSLVEQGDSKPSQQSEKAIGNNAVTPVEQSDIMSPKSEIVLGYLHSATAQARLRQLRLRVPTVLLGISAMVIKAIAIAAASQKIHAIANIFSSIGDWGLLGLLPTDRRAVSLVVVFVVIPFYCYCVAERVSYMLEIAAQMRARSCKILDEPGPCWQAGLILSMWAFHSIVFLAVISRLVLTMVRRAPSAVLLSQLWSSIGVILLVVGTTFFGVGIVFCFLGPKDVAVVVRVTSGLFLLVSGILVMFSSSFREHVQSWFMSRGEAAVSAAGVAQLLGGKEIDDVLAIARNKFAFVPADRVYFNDMGDNNPNPALATYIERGEIGFADCFVSHSWHDDPDQKWSVLQKYREEFKQNHGREPTLWIDKYCIDQQHIDDSLAALPVYLAGCQKLLILCGNTYLGRLWCLIELFVFLEMGRQHCDLDVRILGSNQDPDGKGTSSPTDMRREISDFDPRKARCFTEHDTERLRAVIGSAGYKGIARLVHDVFCNTCT